MAKLSVVDRVGSELRRLRLLTGLTMEQVGLELGWSQAKLSRIESGRLGVTVDDLNALLDALGAPDDLRAELLALIAGDDLGAWMVRLGGPRRRQREVKGVEQRVRRWREHHPLLIPGQLQCRDYTMAMVAASGLGASRVGQDPTAVASERAERQAVLGRQGGGVYEALVDWRSFLRHPGGPDVTVAQAAFMLDRMDIPSITVRILPPSESAGALALGAFVIYEFADPDSRPLVLVETQFVDVYLADPVEVEAYEQLWTGLSAEALSVEETRDWLVSLRDHGG